MAEKQLTLNQQLALLPASIPDSILDFLEDFNYGSALSAENARAAFDQEFLASAEGDLKKELELMRKLGKLNKIHVDAGGRDLPGVYLLRLDFEQGAKGLVINVKIKERSIFRLQVQPGEFNEQALKDLSKASK